MLGVVIAAPAKVMTEFSGWPFEWSAVLVVLATAVYTFTGGIRAVIWTDVMQLFVLLGAPLAALIVLVQRMEGGIPQILAIASEHQTISDSSIRASIWRVKSLYGLPSVDSHSIGFRSG